ncbi:MAG: copper amine oxidase N-terminal domain-containing protein [Clostridia bacterium]|nr:copper amine oxidase N-terminal domain-containing protein [Clostridia bacterium]
MKKFLAVLLAVTCVLCVPTAFAAGEDVKISIDGVVITPRDVNGQEVFPKIIDGTTYLPVRAIAQALNKDVEWDQETTSVYIDGVNEEKAQADGKIKIFVSHELIDPRDANGNSVEPFIDNGTTYLPVRAVAEALEATVEWDNDTRTVIVLSKKGMSYTTAEEAGVDSAALSEILSDAYDEGKLSVLLLARDGKIFCEAYFGLYDADTALTFGTGRTTPLAALENAQGTAQMGDYVCVGFPQNAVPEALVTLLENSGEVLDKNEESEALLAKTIEDIKKLPDPIEYVHKDIEKLISGIWYRSEVVNGYAMSVRLTFENDEYCTIDLTTASGSQSQTESARVGLDGRYVVNRDQRDNTNVEWEKGEWLADDTFRVSIYDPSAAAEVLSITVKFAADASSAEVSLAGTNLLSTQTLTLKRVEEEAATEATEAQ